MYHFLRVFSYAEKVYKKYSKIIKDNILNISLKLIGHTSRKRMSICCFSFWRINSFVKFNTCALKNILNWIIKQNNIKKYIMFLKFQDCYFKIIKKWCLYIMMFIYTHTHMHICNYFTELILGVIQFSAQ